MLTPGTKLGPYEIIASIGAGGMGEVYRARDPRLGRDVAIKISAEQFSDRFEREARAIAALNHPSICTLHDVGPNYLVMELVEGSTLADRLEQGPIPLAESLQIAQQIASALDAAHSRGIVHRDLKPANVKITSSGAKVLDFGLAKHADEESPGDDPAHSPTRMAMTSAGVILGTAAYMAPEQARGHVVDKRADIWAFGVVLYEMVTGRQTFEGGSTSDMMAAVLKSEPDWEQVPERVRPLIQRCLAKDPQHRLRDIGDVDLLLHPAPAAVHRRSSWLPWIAAATLSLLLVSLAFVHFRERPPVAVPMRFQVPAGVTLAASGNLALSPDGRKLAFLAVDGGGSVQIWVRDLTSLEARPLAGSETAAHAPPFFWSPDSRFIAFDGGGTLKKINVSGGPAETLVELPEVSIGGSWNRKGDILIGNRAGVFRVAESGGPLTPVTAVDAAARGDAHFLPTFLSNGRHFLYVHASQTSSDRAGVYVGDLDQSPDAQSLQRLMPYAPGLTYVPAGDDGVGRILVVREGTLVATPFDERRLAIAGESVPVAERVGVYLDGAFVSVSQTDVLAYRTSDPAFSITWFDRRGSAVETVSQPAQYAGLALDTLRRQAAVAVTNPRDLGNADLYVLDLTRGGTSTRLTHSSSGRTDFPVWSSSGSHIAYRFGGPAGIRLYRRAMATSTDAILLPGFVSGLITPNSWSHDDRFLLLSTTTQATGWDLWALRIDGSETREDAKAIPIAGTRFNDYQGQFSPDGRWIAYVSNETGRNEVYLRAFDASTAAVGVQIPISGAGGTSPRWRRDGRELFYLAPDDRMMAVSIGTSPEFRAGTPTVLFQTPPGAIFGDATADGQRFLMVQTGVSPFTVVLNWTKN